MLLDLLIVQKMKAVTFSKNTVHVNGPY